MQAVTVQNMFMIHY